MNNFLFRRVTSIDPVVKHLTDTLTNNLRQGHSVVWLLSGGSAIEVEVAVARKLQGQNLAHLTVTLADERFGQVGHDDSNWQQLEKAGFSLPGARIVPVLTGEDRETTAATFAEALRRVFATADYRIALLGMGPDGHTAGILPGTPSVKAKGWATHYSTDQFERITMTADAIARLDEIVVFATGIPKQAAIKDLERDLPVDEQPAQAVKLARRVTIFNDLVGEKK